MLKQLAEKIRAEISVFDVMRQLGEWEGPNATRQVRCQFHGPDSTPSARVYKDSGIMHCFACANPRYDAVRYLQSHEGISYKDALLQIQRWFNLKPEKPDDNLIGDMGSLLDAVPESTNVDLKNDVEEALIRQRGTLPFERFLELSNLFDQIEKAAIDGFLTKEQQTERLVELGQSIGGSGWNSKTSGSVLLKQF